MVCFFQYEEGETSSIWPINLAHKRLNDKLDKSQIDSMAKKRTTKKPRVSCEQLSLGVMAAALVVFVFLYGWTVLVGPEVLEEGGDDAAEVEMAMEYTKVDQAVPQAVFLTNGQVYFGNMTSLTQDSLVLEDVRYLQIEEDATQEGEDGEEAVTEEGGLSLVELGTAEVHAPTDMLVVERSQVLYWENLTKESAVTQAMQQ